MMTNESFVNGESTEYLIYAIFILNSRKRKERIRDGEKK